VVGVAVFVGVGVNVAVGTGVLVAVAAGTGVFVAVAAGTGVLVAVAVGTGVFVAAGAPPVCTTTSSTAQPGWLRGKLSMLSKLNRTWLPVDL
jgi:hypothetical protein